MGKDLEAAFNIFMQPYECRSYKEEEGSKNVPSNQQKSSNNFPNELSRAERQEFKTKLTKLLSMLDEIADNVIGVIFAAHDTTASILTWLLRYLHDNRDLLEAVMREQEGIQRKEIEANHGITWDDTRHMPLTTMVIQETLTTTSILLFTFRVAVEDVEFKEYYIPKGWKVLTLFRTIHYCADFFLQPEKFDPLRFKVSPRPNTFMSFGNGVHSCPGNELAKLEDS